MIITRTPFRVSFAGGGSDFASFYSNEPGCVLSTAIDKYMYLTVKERFGNTFRISYSKTEIVGTVDGIAHPIVRECLKSLDVTRGLEVVSMADLPAETGVGSSSSFTVGLLHALHALGGRPVTAARLAEEACRIEIERLGEPIGKQDQYIAAFGGFQFIEFRPDGSVFVDPVVCPAETRRELNRRLTMFFTGLTRSARDVLARQQAEPAGNAPAVRELCGLARALREVLTAGRDLSEFGRLLGVAWEVKKSLEPSITNGSIDRYYRTALDAGALGGKVLGAGGGGFLLLYCEPERRHALREALPDLTEVPFHFEPKGSKVIYLGSEHW